MNSLHRPERGHCQAGPQRTPRDIDRFENEGGLGPEDTRNRRPDAAPAAPTGDAGPDGVPPIDSEVRPSTPSRFRQQLRDRIRSIHDRGGPAATVAESFGIECVMDLDQMRAIRSLVGECNDGPFCGAEPGCLMLLGRVRHGHDARGRYSVTVQFGYAASPRRAAGSPDPASRLIDPTGQRVPVQAGADFAAKLP